MRAYAERNRADGSQGVEKSRTSRTHSAYFGGRHKARYAVSGITVERDNLDENGQHSECEAAAGSELIIVLMSELCKDFVVAVF